MKFEITGRKSDIKITPSRDKDIQIVTSGSGCKCKITSRTTAFWNEHPTYVPQKDEFVIYTDYKVVEGVNIPALKIGDGNAYVVDLPFATAGNEEEIQQLIDDFNDHIQNMERHTSKEEKHTWNNKIRCVLDEENAENLIFTIE